MKFGRQSLRSSVLSLVVAGVWVAGCGAGSPEVPEGDDEDDTGGANSTGGVFTGGSTSTGGAFTGGSTSTGGAFTGGSTSTGGSFPTTGGTGSGGTGTSMCLTNNVGAAADLLIDDLEDGNNTVGDDKMPPVRIGYWYTFKDSIATCMVMPPPDPSGATPFPPTPASGAMGTNGAKVSGTGCTGPDFAAGIGFDVNNCMSAPKVYDATAYTGIKFWYKSSVAVRFQIGSTATTPAPNGSCAADCYDHHGMTLTASLAGTEVMVPFTMLAQEWTPTMTPFDKSKILNFQWQIKKENGATFDLTIDNVSFM
jgi:hypothetical protein